MLVGMEHMMEYFYDEPEFVREVLHRIMDFQLGVAHTISKQALSWPAWVMIWGLSKACC